MHRTRVRFHPAAQRPAERIPPPPTRAPGRGAEAPPRRRPPRRSPAARLACTAALLGLSALAACTDQLTGVAPAAVRGPAMNAYTGQYAVPYHPNSHIVGSEGVPWTQSSITVPRAGRYRLRVQGSITSTLNPVFPVCSGTGGIPSSDPTGTFGPMGRRLSSGDVMQVRVYTGQLPYSDFNQGFGFTAVDAQTMETEVTLAAGASLWTMYSGWKAWTWCGGQYYPHYLFSGTHTLTVTELAGATLECKGPDGSTTVERGQTVRCVVRSESQFRVLTRRATATGLTLAESPGTSHAAGTEHVWEGPAVASTQVEMVAEITQGGTTEQKTLSASFTVKPRDWPRLTLDAPVVTVGLRGKMQPFPANGVLGNARASLSGAKIAGLAITRPAGGPNTGLSFLASPLPAVDHSIFLHPALTNSPSTPPSIPQTWRNDQNGVGAGTCTSSMFSILVPFVHRHEGVTQAPDSHWGITAAFYRDNDVEQRFEELYRNGAEAALRQDVRNTFVNMHNTGPLKTQQAAFDAAEYPVINAALGCLVDNNPSDP